MKASSSTLILSLLIPFAFTNPATAGQTSEYCAAKWARSEAFGGSYGEAMMGIRNSSPECYCQADLNKVASMGPEIKESYLKECRK